MKSLIHGSVSYNRAAFVRKFAGVEGRNTGDITISKNLLDCQYSESRRFDPGAEEFAFYVKTVNYFAVRKEYESMEYRWARMNLAFVEIASIYVTELCKSLGWAILEIH